MRSTRFPGTLAFGALAFGGLLCAVGDLQAQSAKTAREVGESQSKSRVAAPAQDETVEAKLERLEREVDELRQAAQRGSATSGGIGRGGARPPRWFESEMLEARIPYQDEMASTEADRIKVGGRLDFEFYDLHANNRDLGVYRDLNQFGLTGGTTEFRIRRLQINLGLELIEDFRFESTLTLDPVVRDQDEGAIDLDEAYLRFGNVARNFFGIEDPSHSFIQIGNYYRWERDLLNRWSESFSLAGTSYYMDEVTGIMIGGDFEEGLFYRVGIDNGSTIGSRDAGVGAGRGVTGAVGNSPLLHDNEQLGDLNNNKDFSIGLGMKGSLEEPEFQYHAGVSYREGRLSPTEQAFLTLASPAYNGGSKKRRFGFLGGFEWDLETVRVGVDAELWLSKDGNGDREAWSFSPVLMIPLDGVYYQKRLFFTGVGFGYRLSGVHLSDGFANQTTLTRSIMDDRKMHTLGFWVDVTRNVDLRLELNNIEPSNRGRSETEWLIQWSVSF